MKYFPHVLAVAFLAVLSFFAYQYQRYVTIYKLETKVYEVQQAQDELEFMYNACLCQRYDNEEDTKPCFDVLAASDAI